MLNKTIDFAYKVLKIEVDWKVQSWKRAPQATSEKEETLKTELTVTSRHSKCKTMRHYNKSNSNLKLLKAVKLANCGAKGTEFEMPG